MKRMTRAFLAVAFAGVLALSPAASIIGQVPATVYAHGHRGGGHHNNYSQSSANYYYCDGHDAHLHNGGMCPYVTPSTSVAPTESYYYCGGHEAHLHANDMCPYAAPATDK